MSPDKEGFLQQEDEHIEFKKKKKSHSKYFPIYVT